MTDCIQVYLDKENEPSLLSISCTQFTILSSSIETPFYVSKKWKASMKYFLRVLFQWIAEEICNIRIFQYKAFFKCQFMCLFDIANSLNSFCLFYDENYRNFLILIQTWFVEYLLGGKMLYKLQYCIIAASLKFLRDRWLPNCL